MNNQTPNSTGVGRGTGLILSLVVFVCLVLIGISGYLKYQLDRSEGILAAPESALPADQDASGKLRRLLGYSGFITAGQNFLATHDHSALADMKADVKNAEEVISRLPEKTPPESRHDLQSIVDMFSNAAHKAEQAVTDGSASFTATDMAPLYAALPVLDTRLDTAMASSRLGAQGELKLWATLLTLIAWSSLIIASACTVGIYLSLRGRHAAPLRALSQSVQNMARGDMRTPIWGMERQDMVGELARAIDLARYHFSQLPDMSLLSEQGPIRIRFEGQARSLFEAMMQNIARDAEVIRGQSASLGDSIAKQKESIGAVANRVESALTNMHREREDSEQKVSQLLSSVAGSANTLRGAQETASAQLNHLILYLEERAKGMAEVTQIAGKQVAQTLQSLTNTELNLRSSAEQSQQTVQKLASSTDELGERLYGAVSLLRAGGKVLTETAENTQSRLNEAINLLGDSETSLRQILVQGFEPVGRGTPSLATLASPQMPSSIDPERLSAVVSALENAQHKLEQSLAQHNQTVGTELVPSRAASSIEPERLQAIVSALEIAQQKLEESLVQQGQTTGAQLVDLLNQQSQQLLAQANATADALEQRVTESLSRVEPILGRVEPMLGELGRLSELAGKFDPLMDRLSAAADVVYAPPEDPTGSLLTEIKTGFEITTRSVERLREQFLDMALNAPAPIHAAPVISGETHVVLPDMSGEWEKITQTVRATNDSLSQVIMAQTERLEARLSAMDSKIAHVHEAGPASDDAQAQLQQQAQILAELASALGAIDAHMQEMETTFKSLTSDGRMAS